MLLTHRTKRGTGGFLPYEGGSFFLLYLYFCVFPSHLWVHPCADYLFRNKKRSIHCDSRNLFIFLSNNGLQSLCFRASLSYVTMCMTQLRQKVSKLRKDSSRFFVIHGIKTYSKSFWRKRSAKSTLNICSNH